MIKFAVLMIDNDYYYCALFNDFNRPIENVKVSVCDFMQWKKNKLEI